jgi:serine/threonine-protein phosphatase 6 regulatory ankyrin repeat subunit B
MLPNLARLSCKALDTDVVLTSPLPQSCPICLEDFYVIRKDVKDEESEILPPDEWTLTLDKNGNEKRIAILPCSHSVCLPCARTMAAGGHERRKCPICRVPFSEADLRHVLDPQDDDDDDDDDAASYTPPPDFAGDFVRHARAGRIDEVRRMLDDGIDVNTRSTMGSALYWASSEGHLEVVRLLLERGALVDSPESLPPEWTPLMAACVHNHTDVAAELLAAGADVNATDFIDFTALMLAAYHGHVETVALLLRNGANVHLMSRPTSEQGRETALMMAERKGHTEVAAMIREARDGPPPRPPLLSPPPVQVDPAWLATLEQWRAPLPPIDHQEWWNAVRDGNLERMLDLLVEGTDVDVADDYGRTALMKASDLGNATVVTALLSSSANVNHMDNDDTTALMAASFRGHIDIVRLLLAAGADVNQTDYTGETALMEASEEGHAEIVRLLLATPDIDINKTNNGGETALTLASNGGHDDIFALLEAVTSLRRTAPRTPPRAARGSPQPPPVRRQEGRHDPEELLDAARNGNLERVQELLDAGADVNQARDGDEWTALMVASFNGHADVVRVLLAAPDINVNQTNQWGATAQSLARMQRQTEVVALLEAFENAAPRTPPRAAQGSPQPPPVRRQEGRHDPEEFIMHAGLGHIDEVRRMLDAGINVDVSSRLHWTALMTASFENQAEIVRLLLDRGADVNKASDEDETALMLASYNGRTEVARMLLDNGANINMTNEDGTTALRMAMRSGHAETAMLLVEYGGD